MKLIDSHAHLEGILKLDIEIKKAKKVGIIAIIAVGSDLESNKQVLSISKKFKDYVFPAFGLHPWDLREKSIEETLPWIERNIDACIAIGEIGLDFWIKKDKNMQTKAFRSLLEIARDYEKPAIIHSRGTWKEAYELVREHKVRKAVFHWYSGPEEILEEIIKHEFFISATLASEYSLHHQNAIKKAPLSNILLETDSPTPFRGKESKLHDLVRVAKAVAKLKGVSEEEVANLTTGNALKFFNLKIKPFAIV